MEYLNEIVHAYTCEYCLTTAMHNNIFDGRGFAEYQFKICGHLVKMLITLEPHGIFCILMYVKLSSH